MIGSEANTAAEVRIGATGSAQIEKDSNKKFLKLLLALLVLAGLAYSSVSWSRPKFNRSEIAYAEISREMSERNSYIVPYYHGVASVDKPVMNYWVIIPCFKAFGASGFTSRIPAILSAVACLAVVAFAYKAAFDWQMSLMSVAILASAQRFWEFASLCMTDMLLTLFDFSALSLLYMGARNPQRRVLYYAAAAAFMGLGTLTKGPVALILPCFAFLLYLFFTRQLKAISIPGVLLGAVVFFAVAAPWYLAVAQAVTSGASIGAWLWHHNVERFFGSAYEWHHSPFYMVASLFAGFTPWSLFLPLAAVGTALTWRSKKGTEKGGLELFMWIWLVLTTTFFTLSHGKMNYYDLPCFPAAAGLVGLYLTDWVREKNPIGKIAACILTAIVLGGALVSMVLLPNVTLATNPLQWIMMPALLIGLGGFCVYSLIRNRVFAAYAGIYASLCATLLSFSLQVAPAMAKQAPANDYLRMLKNYPDDRLAMQTDFANTIDWFDCATFEIHRTPESITTKDELIAFLEKPTPGIVIVPQNKYMELSPELRSHLFVKEDRPYMYEKIDMKYLMKRRGQLTGPIHLLLVSNSDK